MIEIIGNTLCFAPTVQTENRHIWDITLSVNEGKHLKALVYGAINGLSVDKNIKPYPIPTGKSEVNFLYYNKNSYGEEYARSITFTLMFDKNTLTISNANCESDKRAGCYTDFDYIDKIIPRAGFYKITDKNIFYKGVCND